MRAIRPLVNAALERLSPQFSQLHASGGRASIAPGKLLRTLLQAFYGVRSERQLMEQVTYNMLLCWFTGLSMDAPVWDVTVFTKNRERLLAGDIAVAFLLSVMGDPAVTRLLSPEHFSVDGTLIDAWASMKSFRRRDGSDDDPSGPGRSPSATFGVTRAATRRMPLSPIRMHGSIASRPVNSHTSSTPGRPSGAE